jgi:peptidase M48-like protein
MRSVSFFCHVAVLALTVSALGQSSNSNVTVTRNEFPAAKAESDARVNVKESVPSLMLNSISLSAPSVVGGNIVQGRVTMNATAPFDVEVSLAVDPPSGATAPSSVTIKAGETSAAFTVTTPVSKMVIGGADNLVSIYGNYGVTKHTDLTILAPVSFDRMVDRVIQREHAFIENVKRLHPLAETYIQNMQEDKEHNVIPTSDRYFLGRLDLSQTTSEQVFEKDRPAKAHYLLSPFAMLGNAFSRRYVPQGFANMVVMDRDLKKENYYFNFVRQEFLGEIRCIVVDVQPREHAPNGLFAGRMWVEDKDFNVVRFNGTYTNGSNYDSYLHFDSWRANMQPGTWLPSYVYSEESDRKRSRPPFRMSRFKAQTRLWDYDEVHIKHQTELVDVRVDNAEDHDEAMRPQAVPVEAERMWEKLAEDNTTDHLQKIGLLALPGPVDKVLQTVVNNLVITNKLDITPEVRCRVLLTTPIESFTIGHTIVISRGLLDVLPDEGALAMILSHELAHIALGHKIDTKLAFTDRFFFPDPDTFQRMNFERSLLDEQAADAKALELLNNSPYKDKLATAGLFLKQVQERASILPNLIRPHLGNPLGSKTAVRLAPVAGAAPQLETTIDQIAALSLGARINLDPWSNRIEMMSPKHVALLSPAEKMPLEVTPFFPYLSRLPKESLADHAEQATVQHCHSGSCRMMQNEQSN